MAGKGLLAGILRRARTARERVEDLVSDLKRRRPENPLVEKGAVGAGTASFETDLHHSIAVEPLREDRRP